ncbi:methionine ABC transporter ATP-binding protein [Kineosporia sp. NBRC 101677]|uniref:ATP-binding cassette domain-containing protein n=1 Tax=Kineosporia sp. NBRC 101677 TaxID=3032197 RepID=UPI0024A01C6D|nr:ATP-binding cassette domain-containing protein [Kineosporia sp. NBRC 101677]GLY13329.1 methionine ABC transporter ATP-binding protein [Kineosporia sp. NBRC 101677]
MVQNDGGKPRPAQAAEAEPAVAFDHVAFTLRTGWRRRRRQLFDSLSFTVTPGEAVGLLLPEGAGKTSLAKLATGMTRPGFGSVHLLGLDPVQAGLESAGRVGAIVNEHSHLWPDIPLEDALGLLARHLGLAEQAATLRPRLLAERLELTRVLRTRVVDLTVAQRRRAELVAALLPDPELLILDEPTRGMDAASKERIRSVLRQENRMNGRTLLLLTSDLADVESTCPRLLVGVEGRIGFDGNVPALTELLGAEKVLVVDLLAPAGPLDDVPGTQLIAVEAGGLRQRLGITPGHTTTAKVLADVASRARVRNLTLQEPDVAELVRRLTL